MNYKTNKPLFIGTLLTAIYLFTNQFNVFPHSLRGFLFGLAIAAYGAGIYGMHHDITKIKEWKKSLIKRMFKS